MMMMLCMLCVMLSCEAAHRHHEGSARELTLSSCRNIVAGRLLFVLVLRTRKKLQFLLQFLRYKLQFRIVPTASLASNNTLTDIDIGNNKKMSDEGRKEFAAALAA